MAAWCKTNAAKLEQFLKEPPAIANAVVAEVRPRPMHQQMSNGAFVRKTGIRKAMKQAKEIHR
jgi:hypothetical protein